VAVATVVLVFGVTVGKLGVDVGIEIYDFSKLGVGTIGGLIGELGLSVT
jgi:hypothetical protein